MRVGDFFRGGSGTTGGTAGTCRAGARRPAPTRHRVLTRIGCAVLPGFQDARRHGEHDPARRRHRGSPRPGLGGMRVTQAVAGRGELGPVVGALPGGGRGRSIPGVLRAHTIGGERNPRRVAMVAVKPMRVGSRRRVHGRRRLHACCHGRGRRDGDAEREKERRAATAREPIHRASPMRPFPSAIRPRAHATPPAFSLPASPSAHPRNTARVASRREQSSNVRKFSRHRHSTALVPPATCRSGCLISVSRLASRGLPPDGRRLRFFLQSRVEC